MITNGHPRKNDPNVGASFTGLAHDVVELAELQSKLFVLDVQAASRTVRRCLILSMVGVSLLLGSIPVALTALAELLREQWGWSPALALFVAALVGLALSATAVGIAWLRMRSGIVSLERSRDQLNRNIRWIKANLQSQTKPLAEKARQT